MTDKDVIKALEIESTPMERNCVRATYKEDCLGFYCTKTGKLAENCMECKEHTMDWRGRHSKATLDLINRQQKQLDNYSHNVRNMSKDFIDQQKIIQEQQAEIKWKTTYIHSLQLSMEEIKPQIKAEAIKELEAKIHEKLHEAEMHGNFEPVVTREMFNSVVKEMVGEQK